MRWASIERISEEEVVLHSSSDPSAEVEKATDFCEKIHSYLNQSLWRDFQCDGDKSCITRGLIVGTLLMGHDKSSMAELDPTVCAAADIITCTTTGHEAIWSVIRRSEADNYRAEILGAALLQLVLRAATKKRYLPYQTSEVFCDYRSVISHGKASNAILPEKQAQADVLRVLKQYLRDLPMRITFVWVKAHQDGRSGRHQISSVTGAVVTKNQTTKILIGCITVMKARGQPIQQQTHHLTTLTLA